MYCVYAVNIENAVLAEFIPDLVEALKLCETLRKAGCYRFVTMAIEDPNMVGKMGVADVDENYDWHKRRDSISARKKGLT
jgi:hypothetical protein